MADKVLIADDDPDILRFVEVNLSIEGFELLTASDGEEALRRAIEEMPDLAILDVMMPKVDGFEVCRRLREDPRTSNLSIIMLTAKSLSADKVTGLAAGADDYILKPFDPIELVARVKATLRRAREMRDLNPLTGLSGNIAILQELQRRITSKMQFALMHVDLDNFKAFNDFYGFMRGDTAIKMMARVLRDAATKHDPMGTFVGHIGGDDFAVICFPEVAEALAQEIIKSFDEAIPALYEPSDARRGYIKVKDRRDEEREFPIMTVSIGIATNTRREINSHVEASEIAGEMKTFAKRNPESSFEVDRRTGNEMR